MIRFGSVCSGIEAASVAWEPLGWKAAWFSEIEPFPCAVLKHHYPDTPNHGDMTTLPDRILSGEVEAPDVFCGGTPCQAFSVAGNRRSLDDARGNLSLTFCEIADAIDAVRFVRGDRPAIIFWENVPGVLNTADNAFGCFLGKLAGESVPLEPPGGRWTDAGCVYGPKRAVAWRVLDAQYFGVAQRRRRVFVIASAGTIDPFAVCFESEGVRRDTPPSREARKAVAGDAAGGVGAEGGVGVITMAHGQGGAEIAFDRGPTLTCNHEAPIAAYCAAIAPTVTNGPPFSRTGNERVECEALVATSIAFKPGSSADARSIGAQEEIACTIEAGGGGNNKQAVAIAHAFKIRGGCEGGGKGYLGQDEQAFTITCGHDQQVAVPSEHETLYNKGITQGECYASSQEAHARALLRTLREAVGEEAFAEWGLGILDSLQPTEILQQALHGISVRPAQFSRRWVVYCALSRSEIDTGWLLQSLREVGCEGCPPQGWEPSEQLSRELGTYLSELSQPGAQAARFMRDLWSAAEGTGVLRKALSAVQEVGRSFGRKSQSIFPAEKRVGEHSAEWLQGIGVQEQASHQRFLPEALDAGQAWDSGSPGAEQKRVCEGGMGKASFIVRRLTCEEAEFLQGFSRGYTNIPWRKSPVAPDGPRYKALGNSWAVPVVRWLGQRIQKAVNS